MEITLEDSQVKIESNSKSLLEELKWLHLILDTRFKLYFNQPCDYTSIHDIPAPDIKMGESVYGDVLKYYKVSMEERIIVLLALAPHVCPQILDVFFTKNEKYGRGFTEFGGVKGNQHSGFIPTGETAAFVIAGNDILGKIKVINIFDPDHYFSKYKIISLDKDKSNEPVLSGILSITPDYLSYFTNGTQYKPNFSSEFPAQPISTKMEWEDLVIEDFLMDEIQEIMVWIKNYSKILDDWGLSKVLKPGYRSLFYGPPGTGKTLTASLLGKSTGLDVYRIDLSKIVSKYIGETEKNLANIFDQAENKNWVLFFDEADAIFGKRTSTSDSKDRYANQEIAYLLQRIEDFPGVLILATNLKSNMDEAFARRFQSMIYFPTPGPQLRMKLWENAFKGFELDQNLDLWPISKKYEITGGSIINVLRHCALNAVIRDEKKVYKEDVIEGIKKEFRKEGKTV
jgi:AAA+ superfamily predicted ATPase